MSDQGSLFKYARRMIKEWIDVPGVSIGPLADGHIHDTFIAYTRQDTFVLQRLGGTADPEALSYNYGLYEAVFVRNQWQFPAFITNRYGSLFSLDETGRVWRLYPYIKADVLDRPLPDHLSALGEGLGRLHQMLDEIAGEPKALYPGLHDLKAYYDQYQALLKLEDHSGRKHDREVEEAILKKIDGFLALKGGETAIVHGDFKWANVLFSKNAVTGCLDLDTLMRGDRLEDLADCVRSSCMMKGRLDPEMADRVLFGYQKAYPKGFGPEERERFGTVLDKICFELGIRYYMDVLSFKKQFKENAPGSSLMRARELLGVGVV